MAARNRSCQRDFNRRRHLILSKGHDMVFYQRGTHLSTFLLKTMPKDKEMSKKQMEILLKYKRESSNNSYFKQKLFLEDRWKKSIEPSILMQRPPFRYGDIDQTIPRYRRPLTCGSLRDSTIDTLVLARPCMRNKFNLWDGTAEETVGSKKTFPAEVRTFAHEPSLKERSVHFESAISTGGALTKVDQENLFEYWYQMRISSGRDDKTRLDLIKWSTKNNQQIDRELGPRINAIVPYVNNEHSARERCVKSAPCQKREVFITQSEALKNDSL